MRGALSFLRSAEAMMTRRRAAAFVAACGVTAASCLLPLAEVVPRASVVGAGGSGGAGGGTGGAGGGGGAGNGACVPHRWPDPPLADDPSSESLEFVAAVRTVDMGDEAPDLDSVGPKIGYDLDQVCTGEGDGSSCLIPNGTALADFKDGPGGIDNRAAKLFASAKAFSDKIGSLRYSEGAENGNWSILVRVSGYNGTANDASVTVAIFPSPGIHALSCIPDSAKPAWDGSDVWPVDSSGLEKGAGPGSDGGTGPCGTGVTGFTYDQPKFQDTHAYVSKGVLVANLPTAALVFTSGSSGTAVKLTAGFVTAEVVKGANGYGLTKGVLTGRWKATDMFAAVSHVVASAQSVCTDSPIYQAVKLAVCNSRDIAGTLGGPTTPCDALSLALSFEASPAKMGLVFPSKALVSNCPKATDPAVDNCPE